eukprot:scaffold6994_cov120-Cylindrotheca_fusiformis.AAC.5
MICTFTYEIHTYDIFRIILYIRKRILEKEEVGIPSTVKKIDDRAFWGCKLLVRLGLNEGLDWNELEDMLSITANL